MGQRRSTQLVVIDEVFVSQGDAIHPLGDQFGDGVFNEFRITVIGEALGESFDDPRFFFNFPKQWPAGVGSDGPASEDFNDFPLLEGLKTEPIRVTVRLHWIVSFLQRNLLLKQIVAQEAAQCNTIC